VLDREEPPCTTDQVRTQASTTRSAAPCARPRARRGLSQEALGYAARLHRNYVGAIERGEINPTFRVILRLAAGLRVEVSELVRLAERRHREPPVPITLPDARRARRR
jgi:transcriptional regulator with XRE-family HTH domain